MKRFNLPATPEIIVLAVLLALSLLGLFFMDYLVAEPKLLFGRSLTALEPSLFPSIIFVILAMLSALVLYLLSQQESHEINIAVSSSVLSRGVVFFGILTLYALTMEPFGFLISSAIAFALLSVQMGNKSWIQVILLSLLGPALLYLAATRLLAVSLPELNVIELAYARLLG